MYEEDYSTYCTKDATIKKQEKQIRALKTKMSVLTKNFTITAEFAQGSLQKALAIAERHNSPMIQSRLVGALKPPIGRMELWFDKLEELKKLNMLEDCGL